MRTKEREYQIGELTVKTVVTYKAMRSLRMRYDAEKGILKVSCPYLTPMAVIDRFVARHAPSLIHRSKKKVGPYDGQFLYYLGKKVEVGALEEKQVVAFYKKNGLPYLKQRVEELSAVMGVRTKYAVRMRDMKRTYGSNSRKTETLTFQAKLLAYTPEIIDSVVIHELAHHFVFDHSSKFYRVVYSYCPNYDSLRKALIHDRYEG